MDEQRKTVMATLKALKAGQLTAEQAVAIMKLSGVEPEGVLQELAPHIPDSIASTMGSGGDDADADERLTQLLSDGERVNRAAAFYEGEAPKAAPEEVLTLEFQEEAPQSGISLDTRTLLSIDGKGAPYAGVAVRSRLVDGAGRYEIKREFARGGMGRILLARDTDTGRDVAIKELLPELASGGTRIGTNIEGEGDSTEDRFLREAKVTGQLEHPNIVPVYEIGERSDGTVYYTMKYVRGKTLAARLREIRKDEKLSDEQKFNERLKLLDAFVAVCNAMAFAHSRGVIHRDIKPENVMQGDFGETMLLDWGLARVKNQKDYAVKNRPRERNISDSLRESADAAKTQDGYIIGTPAYMPPEQGRGEQEEIDEKSDIYSLGAVLYEVLAGVAPYEGPTAGLVLQAMLTSAPAPISERCKFCPPELAAVVNKAMAREKKDRFASAMALASQVQAFREGRNLSVYQYSLAQLVRRYVQRHKATVAVAAISAFLAVAGGLYAAGTLINATSRAQAARLEAESARDSARLALEEAAREEAAKEALRKREQAQREAALKARAAEIRALKAAVERIPADSLRDDVAERVGRLQRAQAEGASLLLSAQERRENQVVLSSLAGYLSAKDNLLKLLASPAAAALPELSAGIDLDLERRRLVELRLLTARLAAFNGDFALAEHTLSAVKVSSPEVTAQREAIRNARERVLAANRQAIDAALDDVRRGLRRPNRPQGAPQLSEYVDQLAALRDPQTVEIIAGALKVFGERAARGDRDWTAAEFDEVRLLVRTLGQIDLPVEAVPVLTRFAAAVSDAELLIVAGRALCQTRSQEAFAGLAELGRVRFNYVWENIEKDFALVPLPESVLTGTSADDCFKRSLAWRARGDFDRALAECDKGLALAPGSEALLISRALAFKGKRAYESAIANLSAVIAAKPEHARALVARGNCYRAQGDADSAVRDFTAAIALDGRNATPYVARGLARMDLGDAQGGLEDINAALALDARRASVYLYRGNFKNYMGDWQAAVAEYEKALECDAEYAEAWTQLGIIFRVHDFNRCIRDLGRASQLNPRDARNFSWRAQAKYGLDDLVGAINDCSKAVELDPKDWTAWYYRAITHLQLHQRQGRRQSFGEGAPPGSASTASLDAAIADLLKTKEIFPLDFRTPLILSGAYLQLGDRLRELGNLEGARQAWNNAARVGLDLKAFNPLGAHFYNGELLISHVLEDVAAARARLDAESRADTPRELLVRASGRSSTAGQLAAGSAEWRVTTLRAALADLEAARLALSAAQLKEPAFVACVVNVARGLSANGFYADALEIIRLIDGELAAATRYDLACSQSRLATQWGESKVLRLGKDEAHRNEQEFAANSQPEAERARQKAQMIERAFETLELAFRAGYSNAAQASRDPDLNALHTDGRWPAFFARMEELVKSAPALPGPERAVVVLGFQADSQADRAGLNPFDVIWQVNGERVSDFGALRLALLKGRVGESLTLKVRRYKFTPEGDFLPQVGQDGKPLLDDQGFVRWACEEREVQIKRGTTRSLGFVVNASSGLGLGFIPAPYRP